MRETLTAGKISAKEAEKLLDKRAGSGPHPASASESQPAASAAPAGKPK